MGTRIAAVAAAFIVLGSATAYAVQGYYLGNIDTITDAFPEGPRPEKVAPAETKNILLAGVDDRETLTDEEKRRFHVGMDDYGKRSDTMILLHVSDKTKSATAISFPRDSLVTIPAYTDDNGVEHPPQQNKLNAAYAFGGEKLAIATIEEATGIRIDHYIEIDLGGFVRMVDAVGGVDVCVQQPVYDAKSKLDLPAGKSKLDGVQGLAFVRARAIYANADIGRIEAQQKFVGSMVKKATSSGVLLNPVKVNQLLSAATKSISTDMKTDQFREQMLQMRDYRANDISFLTVPIANSNGSVPGVGSVVLWDEAKAKTLFTRLKKDEPLEDKAPAKNKLTVLPGSITVQVLNGAGIQGLGATAADDLARLGFGMADIAKNADVTDQAGTVVRFDPTKEKASRTVIASIPGATGLAVPGLGTTIEVVVGKNYDGAKKVTVTPGGTAPKKATTRTAADDICK